MASAIAVVGIYREFVEIASLALSAAAPLAVWRLLRVMCQLRNLSVMYRLCEPWGYWENVGG